MAPKSFKLNSVVCNCAREAKCVHVYAKLIRDLKLSVCEKVLAGHLFHFKDFEFVRTELSDFSASSILPSIDHLNLDIL